MVDVNGVLTIRQATRMVAKWGCDNGRVSCRCKPCERAYERMQRHLVTVNTQMGGCLLANVAKPGKKPLWTVTRAALQQLHPQWFVNQESLLKTLSELEAVVEQQDELIRSAHRDIGDLRRRLELLASAVETLSKRKAVA